MPRDPSSMFAVVKLQIEPAWLALSRAERRARGAALEAIVARHERVRVRWFDADALGNGYSDFVTCEFDDLMDHHSLWEELRDHEVFAVPYLRLVGTMIGLERAYERYEAALG